MYRMMTDEEFDALTPSDFEKYLFLVPTTRYGFWEVVSYGTELSKKGYQKEIELDPRDDYEIFTRMMEEDGVEPIWIEDPSRVFEAYELCYTLFKYPGMYFPMNERAANLLLKAKKSEVVQGDLHWCYTVPGEWIIIIDPLKSRAPDPKEYKELDEFLDKQA